MSHYGLFCFLGRGHLDPGLAIGRGLRARGHQVTVFHLTIAEAAVRRAGLRFAAIDRQEPASLPPVAADERTRRRPWASTIAAITAHAARTLREGPAALREAGVDAIVADQLDIAAGTVAEHLRLPFVNVSCGPPVYLHPSAPPPYVGLPYACGAEAIARNRRANAFVERVAAPTIAVINASRREWKLPAIEALNVVFSRRGIVTQLAEALELPRATPPHLFYTGQFRDETAAPPTPFAWERLDGRPLVYASMGTVRNRSPEVFQMIAEACAPLDVQLVVSLGGGMLGPADFTSLPGGPIVVHYAPQRALLSRACLTINCAGMNTTLDAVWDGVPIVAIPVAEDQPGVAARIARAGVGVVEPIGSATAARVRGAVERVLAEPVYRDNARRLQRDLRRIDGTARAVHLIERLMPGQARERHEASQPSHAR